MVLLMRLEMLREFGNTPAQKSNLYFWRPRIRFVLLIRGYNLPLCFDRQCHSTDTAPCLLLISIWYLNRIPQYGSGTCQASSAEQRRPRSFLAARSLALRHSLLDEAVFEFPIALE